MARLRPTSAHSSLLYIGCKLSAEYEIDKGNPRNRSVAMLVARATRESCLTLVTEHARSSNEENNNSVSFRATERATSLRMY